MSEIRGLNNLMRQFNTLDSVIQDSVMIQVAIQAKEVQAQAKLLCPVNQGELRNSIMSTAQKTEYGAIGKVFTNKDYASYVEFGTGPTGQENHDGISPDVNVTYSQRGWSYVDTDTGEWIFTNGQAAQPYMYPALKNNEQKVTRDIRQGIKNEIRRVL
jgi:HK97 gp10 family phage protein